MDERVRDQSEPRVTPQMIEAGVEAFHRLSAAVGTEDLVRGIYSAMQRTRNASVLPEAQAKWLEGLREMVAVCGCPECGALDGSVVIEEQTNLWFCHVCGAYGDSIAFVMRRDDISFPEAVAKLAKRRFLTVVP